MKLQKLYLESLWTCIEIMDLGYMKAFMNK